MEIVAVVVTGTMVATVDCEAGDFHEDAPDSSLVSQVLSHGAMHAMSCNHVVHEHVQRSMTVTPVSYI